MVSQSGRSWRGAQLIGTGRLLVWGVRAVLSRRPSGGAEARPQNLLFVHTSVEQALGMNRFGAGDF